MWVIGEKCGKTFYFNSRLSIYSIVFSVTKLFSSPSHFFQKIITERFGQIVILWRLTSLSHCQKQSACHFAFWVVAPCVIEHFCHVSQIRLYLSTHLIHNAFWWRLFLISNPSCYNCSNYSIIYFFNKFLEFCSLSKHLCICKVDFCLNSTHHYGG